MTHDELGIAARSHPLRAALAEEMHLRRLPRFETPARLMQIVTLTGEAGVEASRAHVERFVGAIAPTSKYAAARIEKIDLVWERHTEFASYTLIAPGLFDAPFDPTQFGDIAARLLDGMPGEIIRATQIAVAGRGAPPSSELIASHFVADGLVSCDIASGKARVWSDFRLNADGFGRLYVADNGLVGDEPAQLIQRLQELGNYRNMALLGLPTAQRLTPEVTRLEARLATLTRSVSEGGSADDALLAELTFLSAELARIAAETRYRMNATRAYAQLSHERLESLNERAVDGYQTLSGFTERRLMPAVRTCDSFSARLDDLQQRAAWTSSLLRTRVDTALAKQNRDLLDSMDRRTGVQLRLQQAVEGLSVVAISYYAVSLMAYVFDVIPGVRRDIALAVSAPLVVITAALILRAFRRR